MSSSGGGSQADLEEIVVQSQMPARRCHWLELPRFMLEYHLSAHNRAILTYQCPRLDGDMLTDRVAQPAPLIRKGNVALQHTTLINSAHTPYCSIGCCRQLTTIPNGAIRALLRHTIGWARRILYIVFLGGALRLQVLPFLPEYLSPPLRLQTP